MSATLDQLTRHGGWCGLCGTDYGPSYFNSFRNWRKDDPLCMTPDCRGLLADFEAAAELASRTDCTTREKGALQRNGSLPFASLGTALADAPPEPDWYWQGYVAPGVLTVLGARPKVGKTSLLAALMAALRDGSEFLGCGTRPARVLLLSEEREFTLAEKRNQFALGDDDVGLLMRHQAFGVPWPEVVSEATEHCVRHDYGVLVVDTFNAWAGLRGDDESKSGPVLEAIEPLAAAAGHGLAVVLPVHQRKSEGTHGEALRGSNALAGAVDVIVEMERVVGEPNARRLRSVSRFASTPEDLVAELSDGAYRACGDLAQVKAHAEDVKIETALALYPKGASSQVLAHETGIGEATIRRRLEAKHGRREVDRRGSGKRGDPYLWLPLSFDCNTPLPLGGAMNANGAVAA